MDSLIFTKSYINGRWESLGYSSFDVLNPANKSHLYAVDDGGVDLTNLAIDAAHAAFPEWAKKTAKERSAILEKWHDLLIENQEDLAKIMTLESGKPITESRGEVVYGASFIKWFAEEGKRIYGDVIPPYTSDRRILVTKEPIGVVAAITPWNFPLAMITRKVAPALAAGCSVIVRPSEETPLTALAMAHLAEKAGMPAGVYNTVVGKDPAPMGLALCESKKVKKISFTGSTQVGRLLMKQGAETLKKLSLELGGNAPFIVFDDADLDLAVKGAVASKYRNSGQTCVCVNRFLVHENVYDAFAEKLTQAVGELKVGNGIENDVQIGPLIHANAMKKTADFIADANEKGGEILLGGEAIDECFFPPTIIGNANNEMAFAKEEIFGPIAALFKFSSEEEAITMANDTIYGLAAYFYSQNINRCWKIAEALEYGMVGINEGMISTEVAPFGGVKQSGFGREGSKYGIDDYITLKYLCFGNVK